MSYIHTLQVFKFKCTDLYDIYTTLYCTSYKFIYIIFYYIVLYHTQTINIHIYKHIYIYTKIYKHAKLLVQQNNLESP